MSLSELRSLVRRYVDGEIAYDRFRSEFVLQYLSVRHEDIRIEQDVVEIESACADFDERDISESDLREYLAVLPKRPIVTVDPQEMQSFSSNPALYMPVVERVA